MCIRDRGIVNWPDLTDSFSHLYCRPILTRNIKSCNSYSTRLAFQVRSILKLEEDIERISLPLNRHLTLTEFVSFQQILFCVIMKYLLSGFKPVSNTVVQFAIFEPLQMEPFIYRKLGLRFQSLVQTPHSFHFQNATKQLRWNQTLLLMCIL